MHPPMNRTLGRRTCWGTAVGRRVGTRWVCPPTWTPHTYLRTHFTAYFNIPSYNLQTCLPTNLIILGGARQQDGGGLPHRLVPWLDCLVLRGQRLGPGGEGGRHVLPHLQPLLQQGAGGGVGQARPHLVGPRHLPAGHRGGRVLHGKQRPWRGLRNGRFSSGCRSQDSWPTFHVQGWCESRTGMLKKRRCHPNSLIAIFTTGSYLKASTTFVHTVWRGSKVFEVLPCWDGRRPGGGVVGAENVGSLSQNHLPSVFLTLS